MYRSFDQVSVLSAPVLACNGLLPLQNCISLPSKGRHKSCCSRVPTSNNQLLVCPGHATQKFPIELNKYSVLMILVPTDSTGVARRKVDLCVLSAGNGHSS